ncbi:MAG: BNR repeat-containing protein [Verrucomicrobiota bacterium]
MVDRFAHTFTSGPWGIGINGQTFQQEAVVTHLGWQYAAYFGNGGILCAARRKLPDGNWSVIRFTDYRIKDHKDVHNVAVIGICSGDGTVHLSYDHHEHPLHYRRSVRGLASRPDTMEWKAENFGQTTDELEIGRPITRVTYPQFFSAPGGELQFLYRLGASGDGDWYLAEYSGDRGEWKVLGMLFSRAGEYQGDRSRCAYPDMLRYGPDSRLHVTWCWRENYELRSNHDLCYAYSEDAGRTWRNNAGDQIAVLGSDPLASRTIALETPGIVVAPIPMEWGLMNVTTQFVDAKGRVHVIRWQNPPDAAQPSKDLNAWRYCHYWHDSAGKWHRQLLPFYGRKPQVVVGKNGNIFVIYCQGHDLNYHQKVAAGVLKISAASEASGWSDWTTVWESERQFVGEPLTDNGRWNKAEILSVYAQEAPDTPGNPSPLHIVDFQSAGNQ